MRMLARLSTVATALALVPAAALAHPGPIGHTHGIGDALGSVDVLLAIAAAGLLALAWRVNRTSR
jgi:hydrogenase/urease accessory protein HupE